MYRIGVDEAGRGSLVGEMVVAAFAMRDGEEGALLEVGVRDSKKLSPARRAELYKILRMWPFAAYAVHPRDIDSHNLNVLELKAVFEVLKALYRRLGGGFRDARVTVDKFADISSDLRRMLDRLGFRGVLVVEEGADERYVEVSAASIIAKHLRDRRIQVLRSLYGVEGSGYPSDPRTLEWLARTLEAGVKPPIVRYSWATLERFGLRARKGVRVTHKTLDEYLSSGIRGEDGIR